MTLKELARRAGKRLGQLGLSQQYASSLNTGIYRAGPDAIAVLAQRLGEAPERIAAILDAAYRARHGEPAAESTTPPASPPAPVEA